MAEPNTAYDEHIHLRADETTRERADAIAKAHGMSRSAVVRMLIRQEYRELNDTDDAAP